GRGQLVTDLQTFRPRSTRRIATRLSALTLIVFGLAAAHARGAADPATPETLDGLRTEMQRILDRDQIPGAGVALISGGETLWCGGIGKANVAMDVDVSCDTQFRVGSISKTLALALLKLQQDGKIDLDTPLRAVVPELAIDNAWESSNPV